MNKKQIIKTARERMEEAVDVDKKNRERAFDDLDKLVGNQWPDDIRSAREADQKPCITVNRLPQFVRQVTGDIRRMNPAINVSASDDEATQEIAEIMEGAIRGIENRCDAASIYEHAAESAAACSIGWFRVLNDWRDASSWEQEINIKRVRNPFSVYCDPNAEAATREDAEYLFITEHMDVDAFKEAYPKAKAIDVDNDSEVEKSKDWVSSDKVVVAEYFWKEKKRRTLYMLKDGSRIFKDEAEQEIPEDYIQREREVDDEKVMWAKISGEEVLEGPTEVPCKYIPVIAVTGEEWHLGEEVYRSSVIRFAKDPQQLFNYFRSAEAEIVTLQPKAPYIGTLKQFEGLQTYWQNANQKNYSYLPYNPDEKAPGPPQRQSPPMASQGISQQAMAAADDMKATTGIYDAGLGQQSNETSGVAIRQRQVESDVSTSIYTDNMAKAIGHCGRILLSMIPRVYDTTRNLKILGKDDTEKTVTVNQPMTEGGQEVVANDLSQGTYDLRVSVGPNYSTRRQETAEAMLEFIKAVPGAAQVTGDLIAKAMDFPDSDMIAERLKKMLPPGITGTDDMTPEEAQAMQQQMQQQAQQEAQQQQFMQMMQELEAGKAEAETVEATADAEKAQLEVQEKQLELLINSGAMNEAIAGLVQEQVARALQGAMAPQGV